MRGKGSGAEDGDVGREAGGRQGAHSCQTRDRCGRRGSNREQSIAAENAIWDVLKLEIKAYEVLRASGHFASVGEPFGSKATAPPTPQRYTFWPKKRLELPLMYATAKAILGARIVSTTNEELHCRWLHLLKLRASMSMSQRRPWSGTSSRANTLTRCP